MRGGLSLQLVPGAPVMGLVIGDHPGSRGTCPAPSAGTQRVWSRGTRGVPVFTLCATSQPSPTAPAPEGTLVSQPLHQGDVPAREQDTPAQPGNHDGESVLSRFGGVEAPQHCHQPPTPSQPPSTAPPSLTCCSLLLPSFLPIPAALGPSTHSVPLQGTQ